MEYVSEARKDVREDSSRVLYEDDKYFIGVCGQDPDAHNVLVNDSYVFLGRGILGELARADTKRLRSALEVLGTSILREMTTKNIPLEELGWTLAKAVIKDEEDNTIRLISGEA